MNFRNLTFFSKKGIAKYIIAFGATVMAAVMLLATAAFLPQYIIQGHVADSIYFIQADYDNSVLFDRSTASVMDAVTDTMMLRTTLSTNDSYLGSILTNPVYTYEGLVEWVDVDEMLTNQAYDMPHDDVWFYSRYWMGFRVILRAALLFLTVDQIRRYLACVFFALLMAVVCSMAKNTNAKIAFLFAMSVVLVRPHVIAGSMQYTSCFLIAFLAMLLIPWLHRHREYEGLFFMEVGMITMYFDFYTVPPVTVGFPLVYLCVLKLRDSRGITLKDLGRDLGAWCGGYGFMWIAKLVLTTLLTSENALLHGLQSFSDRVGITKDPELEQFYSLDYAFERLQEALFSDDTGKVVYLLCVGVILAVVIWKLLRGHSSRQCFRDSVPFLILAIIPLVWFVATKQPIAIHAFFQYRNIALTYWAGGMFLYFLLSARKSSISNPQ